MIYRDLLLGALTYPDAIPDRAVRGGVALARRIGGDCTLLTLRVDIPDLQNPFANAVMDFDRLARDEEARSAAAANHAQAVGATAAAEADVEFHTTTRAVRLYEESQALCASARTRDLCLLPVGPQTLASRAMAEAVLFGSGRPVMLYPEDAEIGVDTRFSSVLIAWDGSARAARAVADALPILRAARSVRVLSVLDEKPSVTAGCGDDLVRHLKTHGVDANIEELPASHQAIGPLLRAYASTHKADLVVMGGYGHARLREFVLGGATESLLQRPPCPVLMSH